MQLQLREIDEATVGCLSCSREEIVEVPETEYGYEEAVERRGFIKVENGLGICEDCNIDEEADAAWLKSIELL